MNLILGDGLLGSAVIGASGWAFISRKENGFDINKPNQWKSSTWLDERNMLEQSYVTDLHVSPWSMDGAIFGRISPLNL